MPHSIHTFLEGVKNKAWDDTVIVGNQSIIMTTGKDINGQLSQKNRDAKKVLFPEYSEAYPHTQHTVAFLSGNESLNLYFNLDDHSLIHGPGAQAHHEMTNDADPCFAKITRGLDLLPMLQREGIPVIIKEINIVK
jgi:hypothetical protein